MLVDFYADLCAPCVALAPIVDEIAAEEVGRLRVGRLDTVAHPEATQRVEVQSVPTLILFRDGEPVKRMFGSKRKRQILEMLSDFVD